MTYETELEKAKSEIALVSIDFKNQVARRWVSPMVNRKPVLSVKVHFKEWEMTGELVERIRINNQEGT